MRANRTSYIDSKKLRSSRFNFPVPFGGPTGAFATGLIGAVVTGASVTGLMPRLSGCDGGGGAKSKLMGELIERIGVAELGGGEIVDGRSGGERLVERCGTATGGRGIERGGRDDVDGFGTEEKESSKLLSEFCC